MTDDYWPMNDMTPVFRNDFSNPWFRNCFCTRPDHDCAKCQGAVVQYPNPSDLPAFRLTITDPKDWILNTQPEPEDFDYT
jgi:hypothetical protein